MSDDVKMPRIICGVVVPENDEELFESGAPGLQFLYAIYDVKQHRYSPGVLPYANDIIAIRGLERFVPQLPYESKHPDEFELHHVGYFSEKLGVCEGYSFGGIFHPRFVYPFKKLFISSLDSTNDKNEDKK